MINFDYDKFKEDIARGDLELSEQRDGTINLTNYIMRSQENTRMYDYVNKDVYIEFDPENDYITVEDYGNGCPEWAYTTAQLMRALINKLA